MRDLGGPEGREFFPFHRDPGGLTWRTRAAKERRLGPDLSGRLPQRAARLGTSTLDFEQNMSFSRAIAGVCLGVGLPN